MINKIIIVGATGKLGSKLLSYTNKNLIPIYSITCFKNSNKLHKQKIKYSIKNSFVLSEQNDQNKFFKILEKKLN